MAYLVDPLGARLRSEALASLPGVADFGKKPDPEAVFAGLQNQRIRLKINQQIAEW